MLLILFSVFSLIYCNCQQYSKFYLAYQKYGSKYVNVSHQLYTIEIIKNKDFRLQVCSKLHVDKDRKDVLYKEDYQRREDLLQYLDNKY